MARTHIVMDSDVLEAIDEIVGERGRSRFLEEAAREKLARTELEGALRSSRGIAKGKRYAHWLDRTTSTSWVREGRNADRRS